MTRYPVWAVLTPGKPTLLESRTRSIVMTEWDEEDGKEPPFEIIPGSGLYQTIVGLDGMNVGAEMQLAERLSLECNEPVYSIECANDPWAVMSWRNGALEILDEEPEALARSLGCTLLGRGMSSDLPASKPLRTAALIEGVRAEEAYRVLEDDYGATLPPGHYHIEETPRGLLLTGGARGMNSAHIVLSERFPHATVYGVTASPNLEVFFATIMRGGEGIGQVAQPPYEFPPLPVVGEIKGERSPERILAALGIPAEWFVNE